jgi:hypothetical protein
MMRRRALATMAAYYVVTGAWPLLSMRSFEAVTGPKREHWLVNTVALLAIANGVTLAVGARRARISRETQVLALGSALAFSAIDVIYVLRRCIRPVYLGDAAVELALAALILSTPDPS